MQVVKYNKSFLDCYIIFENVIKHLPSSGLSMVNEAMKNWRLVDSNS